MNRMYLWTILLVVSTLVSCTKESLEQTPQSNTIEIPDMEFEKELIAQGIDTDNTVNGLVLKSDVATLETLEIGAKGIENLTGIEGFVGLKRLRIPSNVLTTIDLSNNVLLDSVNLAGNQLKTIDFSRNKNLVFVELYGNLLETVSGFTNAINLDFVNLSFNYLTEFTISNKSLKTLYIDNNDIVEFDAYLGEQLETLVMYTNKIKTVDLSNNLQLKLLRVADNKITNLTLGQKDHLYYLSCSTNYLSTLNVSQFTALQYLYARDNPQLNCIKIANGQVIGTAQLSAHQQLNTTCN